MIPVRPCLRNAAKVFKPVIPRLTELLVVCKHKHTHAFSVSLYVEGEIHDSFVFTDIQIHYMAKYGAMYVDRCFGHTHCLQVNNIKPHSHAVSIDKHWRSNEELSK